MRIVERRFALAPTERFVRLGKNCLRRRVDRNQRSGALGQNIHALVVRRAMPYTGVAPTEMVATVERSIGERSTTVSLP